MSTRQDRIPSPRHAVAAAASLSLLLVACSGDPYDTPASPSATMLVGVAATGAAMAGARISVVDADSATADPAAVTAGADGSFSVDVSGLKAPFVLQATGLVDGVAASLVAIVPQVNAQSDNTANVTTLTHAVAALLAPAGDALALATPAAIAANVTAQKLADTSRLLVNTLNTDPSIALVLGTAFDPLTTRFKADGSGIDAVLDKLAVATDAAGVSITNLAAAVDDAGGQTAVRLTAQGAETPSVVPTLPPSAPEANLPSAARIAEIGRRYEACLALPVAQRVTLGSDGAVTAVSAACDFAATDWRSNGRSWTQEVGQYTLAKNLLTGARVGHGRVVLAVGPAQLAGAKDFKHPFCNDGPCVVVRYPLVSASGQATSSDWVMGKTGGEWALVGNQRPYRFVVEPRLNRRIAVNVDGAAAGNNSDPYFFTSRYESSLRLQFDPSSAGAEKVRAVRFSGPGLPAAGVVVYRSQRCGSSDHMAIHNQLGTTRLVGGTAFQFWTGGSGSDFILDAARLDGSVLAMPKPVVNGSSASFQNFAPEQVADLAAAIPAWSRYKVELFHYDVLSDEPDQVLFIRISTAGENARAGLVTAWPTLAPSFIDAYLKPGGTRAGEVEGLGHTVDWAAPSAGHVGSAWLFGQNVAGATNAQGETANYVRRGRLDFEPLALGDARAVGVGQASVASGTSLSSFTANSGSNPNPRCTSPDVVGLTSNINDYREAGLFVRGADRKARSAHWFWDN